MLLYVHRNRNHQVLKVSLTQFLSSVGHCFRFSVALHPQKPSGSKSFTDTVFGLCWALFRFSVTLCPQKPPGFTDTVSELCWALSLSFVSVLLYIHRNHQVLKVSLTQFLGSVGHCFVLVLLYIHRNHQVLKVSLTQFLGLCWALFRSVLLYIHRNHQVLKVSLTQFLGSVGHCFRFSVALRPQKTSGLFGTGSRAQDDRLDFPTQLLVELCGHC